MGFNFTASDEERMWTHLRTDFMGLEGEHRGVGVTLGFPVKVTEGAVTTMNRNRGVELRNDQEALI